MIRHLPRRGMLELWLLEMVAPAMARVLYAIGSVIVPELLRLWTVGIGGLLAGLVLSFGLHWLWPVDMLPLMLAAGGYCVGFPARWAWMCWQKLRHGRSLRELSRGGVV